MQSKTIEIGKCEKLLPKYCGAFKKIKMIGEGAYKIELLEGIRACLVFYVSKLKRTLHPLKNVVFPNVLEELIKPPISLNVLEELIKPPIAPHEPKRVLRFRDRCTRQSGYEEALVKWKNLDKEASTWEWITMLWKKNLFNGRVMLHSL